VPSSEAQGVTGVGITMRVVVTLEWEAKPTPTGIISASQSQRNVPSATQGILMSWVWSCPS
jgi:hypothetical protein